ncbi:MAG TPA: hypothetical protein DEQ34_06840 [Balneolaceae bacterium]|nr:hypothetical protein [Balneolaceae bacterium]|tara:strand:- start:9126 stop:9977 length:852 start_codon:yes stop_codon:yes gene_type:complete
MKLLFINLSLLFITVHLSAQTVNMDDEWILYSDIFDSESRLGMFSSDAKSEKIEALSIEGIELSHWKIEKQWSYFSDSGFNFSMNASVGDSIFTYSLIAITQGNPHYALGLFTGTKIFKQSSKNTNNCFIFGDCAIATSAGYLRLKPERMVSSDQIKVSASTAADGLEIKIEEVRFTEKSTELLLHFVNGSNLMQTYLREPGDPEAFFIRDRNGRKYKLIGQFGWQGFNINKFGNYNMDPDSDLYVILYFEPVPDTQSFNRFDLIEGECEDGCWNLYDVRLND